MLWVKNQTALPTRERGVGGGILVIREVEEGRRVVSDLILVFLPTVPLSP